MNHEIVGLENLPLHQQVEVLASLLKDKIKQVNGLYWKDNDPCIRIYFWPTKEAMYGIYVAHGDGDRINLLAQPFKTEN